MINTKQWLEKLRQIGWRLSVADENSRSEYATELLSDLLPDKPTEFRKKFGISGANMDENIHQARAKFEAAHIKGAVTEWQFAEDWARNGFPQVIVEPKLFASLAQTSIPQELIPDFAVPWDCFIVRIPDEMMGSPVPWGDGSIIAAPAYITCWRMPEEPAHLMGTNVEVVGRKSVRGMRYQFAIHPAGAPGCSSWVTFSQPSDLVDASLQTNAWDGGSFVNNGEQLLAGNLLKEQTTLLRRLFVGVLIELMSQPEARGHAKTFGSVPGRRNAGAPSGFTFVLTRPVIVDCRRDVRERMSGKHGKQISVQVLVRGHWKNQPCGTGRSERKFIHIEPYWRGPEDAPIAVRPHIINGPAGDA